MKYFIDTEFRERPHTIDLISIGIVAEDGREYYAISRDFNIKMAWADQWLRENVLLPIYQETLSGDLRNRHPFSRGAMQFIQNTTGRLNNQIAQEVLYFCSNGYFDKTGLDLEEAKEYDLYGEFKPEFYGYYADYDWVVFCWLFGRMLDLPKGFPMYCRDLKQILDEKGLDKEWKAKHCPKPKDEHNALADARWNLKLFKAIESCE
jgi:hypothetical protein